MVAVASGIKGSNACTSSSGAHRAANAPEVGSGDGLRSAGDQFDVTLDLHRQIPGHVGRSEVTGWR